MKNREVLHIDKEETLKCSETNCLLVSSFVKGFVFKKSLSFEPIFSDS